MKKIKLIFLSIMLLFTVTSCDSLLDVSVKHALPQDKIKTVAGCESLIIGVYDQLQDSYYAGRDLICIPDILGDNSQLSPGSTNYTGQYNFQPYYNIDIWESAYKQIGALNEAIFYLSELEQTKKVKSLTGEALFLRAYNYFNLSIVYSKGLYWKIMMEVIRHIEYPLLQLKLSNLEFTYTRAIGQAQLLQLQM